MPIPEILSPETVSGKIVSSKVVSAKSVSDHLENDADRGKGSMEPDERTQASNYSMTAQLGHRNPDPLQDGADSDFPEPGHSPEHSFEGEFKKIG